jgi:transcriptional regulator NrdR family protein
MECPKCGTDETTVGDVEARHGGRVVHRRRKCEVCNFSFVTHEKPYFEDPTTASTMRKQRGPYRRVDRHLEITRGRRWIVLTCGHSVFHPARWRRAIGAYCNQCIGG